MDQAINLTNQRLLWVLFNRLAFAVDLACPQKVAYKGIAVADLSRDAMILQSPTRS